MYHKKNWPEKDELVVCTVKKVDEHSVFADLDEYEKKEVMVHSSEMLRKTIRTMRSSLKVGSKIVCRVIEVEPARNIINLSMRRVGEGQKRTKLAQWNNEIRANDILEVFAKANKITPKEIYEKIGNRIIEKYGALYPFFAEAIKEGEQRIADVSSDKNLAKKFSDFLKARITLPKAEISGIITMQSNSSDGLDVIKKAVSLASEISKKKKVDLRILYLGAPNYKFKLSSESPKTAEEVFREIAEKLKGFLEKSEGSFEIRRD